MLLLISNAVTNCNRINWSDELSKKEMYNYKLLREWQQSTITSFFFWVKMSQSQRKKRSIFDSKTNHTQWSFSCECNTFTLSRSVSFSFWFRLFESIIIDHSILWYLYTVNIQREVNEPLMIYKFQCAIGDRHQDILIVDIFTSCSQLNFDACEFVQINFFSLNPKPQNICIGSMPQ